MQHVLKLLCVSYEPRSIVPRRRGEILRPVPILLGPGREDLGPMSCLLSIGACQKKEPYRIEILAALQY